MATSGGVPPSAWPGAAWTWLRGAGTRDARAGEEASWATVVPDETYRHHSALAAVVVALGDAGGFYVDDITIDVDDITIDVRSAAV